MGKGNQKNLIISPPPPLHEIIIIADYIFVHWNVYVSFVCTQMYQLINLLIILK